MRAFGQVLDHGDEAGAVAHAGLVGPGRGVEIDENRVGAAVPVGRKIEVGFASCGGHGKARTGQRRCCIQCPFATRKGNIDAPFV
jgi:hypothetical protein